MKIIYDGDSLPMIDGDKYIYRVQVLRNGRWETLEFETEYQAFLERVTGEKVR